MDSSGSYDVIVIGGGLAGLTTSLHLGQQGVHVLLLEKYKYPHHKVCGEYVSNEVMPYLKGLGVDPFEKGAVPISRFEISDTEGKKVSSPLSLGGFGISRFAFDDLLYEKAKQVAEVIFASVETVQFQNNGFSVQTLEGDAFEASYVVGAFGKRSLIDTFLKRKFIQQKSPWLGVKAHYEYDFPSDTVSLHNFEGGYCGLSQIETGAVNACYLTNYESFKTAGSIEGFQAEVLSQNPHLKNFFKNAKPLFEKPLSISQISFEKKLAVEDHIFMVGDSAGLIHPLCGNGMAMAIHSAKLFCDLFLEVFQKGNINRSLLEEAYRVTWNQTFTKRLRNGRIIQRVLLRPVTAQIGLKVARMFPSMLPKIIKQTHGDLLV